MVGPHPDAGNVLQRTSPCVASVCICVCIAAYVCVHAGAYVCAYACNVVFHYQIITCFLKCQPRGKGLCGSSLNVFSKSWDHPCKFVRKEVCKTVLLICFTHFFSIYALISALIRVVSLYEMLVSMSVFCYF